MICLGLQQVLDLGQKREIVLLEIRFQQQGAEVSRPVGEPAGTVARGSVQRVLIGDQQIDNRIVSPLDLLLDDRLDHGVVDWRSEADAG